MGYDVVIVGAGPAGAVLAYLLAKAGAQVLLLEKKVFPRYKACGGGLTKRALDSLPFEIADIVEERVHTVRAFIQNECAIEISVQEPVISMVMRDRFDHFLKDGCYRLEDYTRVLGEDIAKDLSCARRFAGILYGFSNLSARIIRAHGRRLAALQMEVVCGRMSYRELYRKLLHFNRVLPLLLSFSK